MTTLWTETQERLRRAWTFVRYEVVPHWPFWWRLAVDGLIHKAHASAVWPFSTFCDYFDDWMTPDDD